MTSNDDKLLGRLFSEAAHAEIPDGGFSRRVMRSLPDGTLRRVRLWRAVCVAACVVLCVALRLWREAAEWFAEAIAWFAEAAAAPVAPAQPPALLHMAVAVAVVLALVVREALDRERAW